MIHSLYFSHCFWIFLALSTWLCVTLLRRLRPGAAAAQLLGFLERARQLASVPRALAVAGEQVVPFGMLQDLNSPWWVCLFSDKTRPDTFFSQTMSLTDQS